VANFAWTLDWSKGRDLQVPTNLNQWPPSIESGAIRTLQMDYDDEVLIMGRKLAF